MSLNASNTPKRQPRRNSFEAIGGWRFGNTINGCQAEYVVVPDAQANLAKISDALTYEDVVLCPDIMSTGISAAEKGGVRIGDAVAVFAQGPIGLCATAGARLCGASLVIGVESVPKRSFPLAKIEEAYELFAHQRDGVLKVAIRP